MRSDRSESPGILGVQTPARPPRPAPIAPFCIKLTGTGLVARRLRLNVGRAANAGMAAPLTEPLRRSAVLAEESGVRNPAWGGRTDAVTAPSLGAADTLGSEPKRLSPVVPERKPRSINNQMPPISGIKLIKMNVGIGIMAMPTAFYNSGTVFGLVALSAISIITIHCMHLLVSYQLLKSFKKNRNFKITKPAFQLLGQLLYRQLNYSR